MHNVSCLMNQKLEEAVAGLRCVNKPVKQIAKTLGIKKDEIEKIIKEWILQTDPYISELIRERKVNNVPDTGEMKADMSTYHRLMMLDLKQAKPLRELLYHGYITLHILLQGHPWYTECGTYHPAMP